MPSQSKIQNNGTDIDPVRETLNFVGVTIADNAASNRTDITFTTEVSDVTVAANKNLTMLTGTGAFDASLATGVFKTSTGANTVGGNLALAAAKTLTVPSGATSLTGAVGGAAPLSVTGAIQTSGATGLMTVTGAASTAQTLSTEINLVNVNLAQTVQWATGSLTTERAMLVQAPILAFVGASTVTNAATLAVSGAATAGANATITNNMALWVQAGAVNLGQATIGQATNVNTPVTINGASGVITTQTATTATRTAEAGFVVTNNAVLAGSAVIARVVAYSGTYATNGQPDVDVTAVAAGQFTCRVINRDATNALNGTMKIHFHVL